MNDRLAIFGNPQTSNARTEIRRDKDDNPYFFCHVGSMGDWSEDWEKAVSLNIYLHADGDYHIEGYKRFGSDDNLEKWEKEHGNDCPPEESDKWPDPESCESYLFRAVFVGENVDQAIVGYLLELMYHIRESDGITDVRTYNTIMSIMRCATEIENNELNVGSVYEDDITTPLGICYEKDIKDGNQYGTIKLEVVKNTFFD